MPKRQQPQQAGEVHGLGANEQQGGQQGGAEAKGAGGKRRNKQKQRQPSDCKASLGGEPQTKSQKDEGDGGIDAIFSQHKKQKKAQDKDQGKEAASQGAQKLRGAASEKKEEVRVHVLSGN